MSSQAVPYTEPTDQEILENKLEIKMERAIKFPNSKIKSMIDLINPKTTN
jgi:hypothetical protein